MLKIIKEKNTKLIKFRRDMNESITLISCNHDNYNAKTIDYDELATNWDSSQQVMSFFNYAISDGFEDKVRPLYLDDEEAIIEVITYYFKEN